MLRDDHLLQDRVGDGGQKHHHPVNGGRQRGEVILAHPAGDERHERQPEEEVQVRPQNLSVDSVCGVEHVVMIVPVDAQVDEAQHVSQKHRHEGPERFPVGPMRDPQFQHHDRDQDRDHAVAERFETSFIH